MKQIVNTENAPSPVGPYNQAIIANGMLFLSGQIAINPVTKELVLDDIKNETRQVMTNIMAVLHEAGATFENVVKVTIFMADMGDYSDINDVYSEYFDNDKAPAREAVAVKTLPKNANVEISVIAAL
ncbi:MAG: 2-iminobutanoate/2-iminopropanoate deaminase [Cognaticolwellia sp.]|jgi:2-iminobutanoate/2-iminopropanoate deaminase